MKILPIAQYGYGYNNNYKSKTAAKQKSNNNLSFTSIFADAKPENEKVYALYTVTNPEFDELKSSSTRIFRELPAEYAIAKLLNQDKKTTIKVLGSSDGSEAYAYAIALKEVFKDKKASENVKITAVEKKYPLTELAKTGRIVCSDIEKDYAVQNEKIQGKSPLAGKGWDSYLIKSQRPKEFTKLLEKYPYLYFMENDPVVGKSIGSGLDWYEVNKEGLPEIKFETGDMRDYFTSDDEAEQEVYVVANSAAYLIENKGDPDEYCAMFEKIYNENKGKNKDVYIVTGNVEHKLTNPNYSSPVGISRKTQQAIEQRIRNSGFKNVSEFKLRKKGIVSYKEAALKIYKMEN